MPSWFLLCHQITALLVLDKERIHLGKMLIEESYASKGFHCKAKSCNWGPMAGFVLEDPRLTKRPESEKKKQISDLEHAFEAGAETVPLFISEARRKYIEEKNHARLVRTFSSTLVAPTRYYEASSPDGKAFHFVLRKHEGKEMPAGATEAVWGVYFGYGTSPEQPQDPYVETAGLSHVMAMVDPLMAKNAARMGYKAAITGDYDLFSLFTESKRYSPDTLDKRMVSHQQLEHNINTKAKDMGEDPHLGNMTWRLNFIRDSLNNAIRKAGYAGGDMVHHSDEGGRPFVRDLDLPLIAFVPNDGVYGISDLGDMRQFLATVITGKYAPVFNPGWMKELMWGSNKAADQLHSELRRKVAKMGLN